MRNMDDIHAVIKVELNQWFPRQCQNNFDDYYWYYMPTTAEHNGGLSICKETPANPDCVLVERVRKDLPVEQNHNRMAELARRLPILEYDPIPEQSASEPFGIVI